jgi:hypothetical protein
MMPIRSHFKSVRDPGRSTLNIQAPCPTVRVRVDGRRSASPVRRWDGAEPAALERVLFHLVQEYARHLGHIDIVAELSNVTVGRVAAR